jgi:tetratricopeptide (TPR) repeat protein
MLDYYRSKNDFTKAITASDEILKEQKQNRSAKEDTLLICDVLFAKGLIYAHDLSSPDAAKDCFTSIIKDYPDNDMVSLAENELGLLGVEVEKKPIDIQTGETDNLDFSVSNYPNPFNPSTTISYTLPEEGRVQIKVFDALGREVETLLDGVVGSGKHSVYWNRSSSASGIYFYGISFKGQTLYKKMIIVK